jgi:hypothetical protein
MKKLYVMQGDIEPDTMIAMSTPDIEKPATIKKITLPPQPEGEGWMYVRFAHCKRRTEGAPNPADTVDITQDICGAEKVFLGSDYIIIKPNVKIMKYYWWFVIFLVSKMNEEKFLTFKVEVESG